MEFRQGRESYDVQAKRSKVTPEDEVSGFWGRWTRKDLQVRSDLTLKATSFEVLIIAQLPALVALCH